MVHASATGGDKPKGHHVRHIDAVTEAACISKRLPQTDSLAPLPHW